MLKSTQGFALVIVIWILTLLSLMAGSFAQNMRRESSVSLALKNNAAALALTETGLGLAEYMMQQGEPEQRWLSDGTIYQVLRSDGSIRIKLISETGKIDINAADETLLSAVVNAAVPDSRQQQLIFDSILDWRDGDDDPKPHGAEKKQYQDAGLAYAPNNRPFQTLEELQMVLGMNADIYALIQPWITIYSGQSEVDLEQAMPEVLQIISNNLNEKNIQNPALQQKLSGATQQNPNGQNPAQVGDNANRTYTIMVEVLMEDGASATVESVIRFQSQDPSLAPLYVMDWKLNQSAQSLFSDDMESRIVTVQNELTINN